MTEDKLLNGIRILALLVACYFAYEAGISKGYQNRMLEELDEVVLDISEVGNITIDNCFFIEDTLSFKDSRRLIKKQSDEINYKNGSIDASFKGITIKNVDSTSAAIEINGVKIDSLFE